MAPVRVKSVVSFSSQDDCHKASNLIANDGSKYWLSNIRNRSGKAELVLQLEHPTQLAYLDIGTVWCASLEIRVGRSDWHQTREFKPLLPTVTVMSFLETRLSRGVKTTQMFSTKDFSPEVSHELWDRLHIICGQPHRKDVQFGISFIHIKNVSPSSVPGVQSDPGTALCPAGTSTLDPSLVPRAQSDPGTSLSPPGKSTLDASSIQKHFFGEVAKNCDGSPTDMLKYRLMKMAGSTESGCEQAQALSRTAKLVLKASENNKPYSPRHIASPLPKKGLFSEHLAKKSDVPIDKEIKSFLPTLNVSAADIDKVTIADLRHKLERRKRRKLTKEEKMIFSDICQDFICDLFDNNNEPPEADKSSSVLKTKIPTEKSVTVKKPDNSSNGPTSPRSASKLKKTPNRKRELQFMRTGQLLEAVSRTLSSPVDTNCSSVSKSSLSDDCINKDDWTECFTSEAPTKNKHLSKLPVAENYSTTSLGNMIPGSSSQAVPAVTSKDKDISYEPVKKRRKWNQDKTDAHNLVCDNGDLKLLTVHSPQRNNGEKQTISKQKIGCEGKPGKLKRINKTSLDLLQEFRMEVINSEDNPESITNRSRSIPTTPPDTAFCDRCYGMYPADTIYTHQAFCIPPANHTLGHVTSAVPSWAGSAHEMLIDDNVDYAECPICLQRFPQDVLLVHASDCGI